MRGPRAHAARNQCARLQPTSRAETEAWQLRQQAPALQNSPVGVAKARPGDTERSLLERSDAELHGRRRNIQRV